MTSTPPDLARCRWPQLDHPFGEALRDAVVFILSSYKPTGIVAGGSILRGQGDASSDLDIYVIHREGWRQRVQKRFNGVPVEIFVNPPARVRRYFAEQRKAGRPITAHLLTTGFVVYAQGDTLAGLQAEAAQVLEKRPDLTPQELTIQRYFVVDLLDNAGDVMASAPETALFFLEQAMQRLLVYAYLAANRNLPRAKEMLDRLRDVDVRLQQTAFHYYRSDSVSEKYAAACAFAQQVLGVTTFFEWSSQPETVS